MTRTAKLATNPLLLRVAIILTLTLVPTLLSYNMRTNNLAQARDRIERALGEAPENANVQETAGLVYERLNDLPKAKHAFGKINFPWHSHLFFSAAAPRRVCRSSAWIIRRNT